MSELNLKQKLNSFAVKVDHFVSGIEGATGSVRSELNTMSDGVTTKLKQIRPRVEDLEKKINGSMEDVSKKIAELKPKAESGEGV